MTIPDDLKIFSLIYEYRFFALVPLYAAWMLGGFYLLFRLKKVFFLWLLIFPLVLSPLQIAFVYSGWHYRMELYDRFAKTPHGWHDIDCMPPAIRAEYAKHNYHPRFRDMKALGVGTIVLTPLLYALGGLAFITISSIKSWLNRRKKVEKRIEYLVAISISLIMLEFGFFYALVWYWSGFEWSPFGYETCGMEFLAILLLTYPAFVLGLLIRLGLLFRWKFPHYVWYLPLSLCGIASCAFEKSLEMGIFCIIAMLALPIIDFFGIINAIRKTRSQ